MTGPKILTYTGQHLDPCNLNVNDIDILDIAHALSMANRFAGHTAVPINVAQHSVYVSRLCTTPHDRLQGLLHDASEAYLGDVTKWVKKTDGFAEYRRLEFDIQCRVYERFNCALDDTPAVQAADKLMLRFEGLQGFGYTKWRQWSSYINYELVSEVETDRIGKWKSWNWRQSEEAFLTRFRTIAPLFARVPGSSGRVARPSA